MTEKDKILKDISLRLYIPLEVVKECVSAQFDFIHKIIKEGDRTDPDTLKNINVTHLGKWAVKPSKIKFYNKLKDDRTEDSE